MVTTTINNQIILSNHTEDAHTLVALFDPDYLLKQQLVLRTAKGRGQAWIFNHQSMTWVLRHYHRGGLIGRVNKDRYVWTGLARSRVAREFVLLSHLHSLGLPVSQPIAARVVRDGLFYRADIITKYIPHTATLAQLLHQQQPIDWPALGYCLAQLHKHRVYHDDLNAHNLLVNDGAFSVIDFDKGQLNASHHQLARTLSRLKRSILKEATYPIENDWQKMLASYLSGVV